MSALLNALTTTPEASRAQVVADGAARTAALRRWQGELNKYSDDKYRNAAVILPDDLQYLKAFLRKRVDAITTNTRITTNELVALDQNVDTLNYQTLLDTYALRNTLVGMLTRGETTIDAAVDDLRKKDVSVPADVYAFKALVAGQKLVLENDLRSPRLMSKDVLQDKMAAFWESVGKLPTLRAGGVPKTIEAAVERLKKASIDAALQAQENPIKNILTTGLGIAGTIVGIGILLVFGLLSSSYAMNSMVHRGILFRILAGLYGLVFMPVVLIHYWVNRLFLSKKIPKSFAFLPLLEGDRNTLSRTVALFFSFLYFTITDDEKARMMRGEVVEAPAQLAPAE